MKDWNIVVTVREGGFAQACRLLGRLGRIERTYYYNVLVGQMENGPAMLERLSLALEEEPGALDSVISRLAPAESSFTFQGPEDFERKARETALAWVPRLAAKSFHARLHRRGMKSRLSSPEAERRLDEALLDALRAAGTPGSISFDDPDAVIAVETVDGRAGMSLWTREDLQRYPFLRPD